MKKQYLYSFFDQATISGFQFVVTLVAIKLWSPYDYGLFTVFFTTGLILVGFQNALINTPYSVNYPKVSSDLTLLRNLEGGLWIASLLLLSGTSLLSAVVAFCLLDKVYLYVLPFYLFSVLYREYVKSNLVVRGRVDAVFYMDFLNVIFSAFLGGGLFFYFGINELNVPNVLLVFSIVNILTFSAVMYKEYRRNIGASLSSIKDYKEIWVDSKWSLLGMVTTELQSKGYIFILSAFFGAAFVGFVQAGRVFFGPLNLVTSAWGRIARPSLSRLAAEKRASVFLKISHRSAFGFLLFNLLFGFVLWFFWPPINEIFFSDKYSGVEIIIVQWFLVTVIFQLRSVYSISMQSLNKFKFLAFATVLGAALSVASLIFICFFEKENWVVISVVLGESLALMVIIYFIYRYKTQIGRCDD